MQRGAAVYGRESAAEQAWHGAPESIDRLVRIAHDDQARMRRRRRNQLQQLELRGIDVLELVHEDETKSLPQVVADGGVRLQKLDGARDEVAEVEHAGALEAQLISLVDGGKHAQ